MAFQKGNIPWNKGRKCGHLSKKTKEIMSAIRKGHPGYMKGKYHSEETKKKMRVAHEIPWNKGNGIDSEEKRIRRSIQYSLWRSAIFARDGWTCQKCNKRGVKLNAHHIKPFSKYPELRLAIDNGITYCEKCHKEKGKK